MRIFVFNRKLLTILTIAITSLLILLSFMVFANLIGDRNDKIIVIDAGHGGIDGGAFIGGVLEKDVNLYISLKLKQNLEQKGYTIVMTRETDIALDNLSKTAKSRQQNDLTARANIINNSNAKFFLSIHTNCNIKRPDSNGAIVFYSEKDTHSKDLAYAIQRSLNSIVIDGEKRTIHDPKIENFFLLRESKIPGVIVETAFLSNDDDRTLLNRNDFKDEVTKAILNGIEKYLSGVSLEEDEALADYYDDDYFPVGTTEEIYDAKLAIIIDDFGQNRNGVEEFLAIKKHLTFAVMPFLTYSQSDAKKSYENGFEVIAHLPLEANGGKNSWVGPRPILCKMPQEEIKQLVRDCIKDIPYVVGANIHMGSKAGADEFIISNILDVINEEKMYFVDSRSCENPVAKRIADQKGIKCFDRNVLLDGRRNKDEIKKQLGKAMDIALKNGRAIAIGHVGTEGGKITAQAVKEMLPIFEKKGVELVFVSEF